MDLTCSGDRIACHSASDFCTFGASEDILFPPSLGVDLVLDEEKRANGRIPAVATVPRSGVEADRTARKAEDRRAGANAIQMAKIDSVMRRGLR